MSGDIRLPNRSRLFTLGLVHYMAYPEMMAGGPGVPERIEAIARDEDFSVLEVTHIESDAERRRVAEIRRTTGRRIIFSGAPPLARSGLSLSAVEPAARERAVEFARRLAREAHDLGAELVFFISGGDPVDPEARSRAREALQASLEELCAFIAALAPPASMKVAIEPAEREIEHRQLIGPFSEAADLAERVRRRFSEFGLVVDLSHIHQLGEDPRQVLARCRPYIWDYHLANVVLDDPKDPRFGDKHPPFGVAGGRVGVRELSDYLRLILSDASSRDIAGRPNLSLEVRPAPGEDPDDVLAQSKEDFFRAWAAAVGDAR